MLCFKSTSKSTSSGSEQLLALGPSRKKTPSHKAVCYVVLLFTREDDREHWAVYS